MNDYRPIRTPEDAQELKKLWSARKPGILLSVNFHPHITETGEEEYKDTNGITAISCRLLVTRKRPFSEIEILCRGPTRWDIRSTFFANFVFDDFITYSRIGFLPHLSQKAPNYKDSSSICALMFAWRYVDDL